MLACMSGILVLEYNASINSLIIITASKTLQGLLSISETMYKTTSLSSLFLPNDPVFLLPADKLASTTEICKFIVVHMGNMGLFLCMHYYIVLLSLHFNHF